MSPSGSQRLPAYALYGEHRPLLPDRLHAESIAERSRLHGWEIRPHRHAALCQLLVIERGGGRALLDGRTLALVGPAFVTVPALAAHGFQFDPDVEGVVFTMPEPHLVALLQPHAGLLDTVLRARVGPLPAGGSALQAAAALRAETRADAAWRGAALDAALLRLAVALAREAGGGAAGCARAGAADDRCNDGVANPPRPRALDHVQRLRALVELGFRRHPSQASLAAQIGITPTQLNRACQQVLGRPALSVLHARLLLQAQRELAYTTLSVKQVAFELGFDDAAYFTRFFQRLSGQSPSAWRAAHRAEALPQVQALPARQPDHGPAARVPRPANRNHR